MTTSEALDSLIPITMFNKGQASKIFDKLSTNKELIVLKNNVPSAVILSPSEYKRLSEIAEDYFLLLEATKRMAANEGKQAYSESEVMELMGISEEDIANADERVYSDAEKRIKKCD